MTDQNKRNEERPGFTENQPGRRNEESLDKNRDNLDRIEREKRTGQPGGEKDEGLRRESDLGRVGGQDEDVDTDTDEEKNGDRLG